MDIGSIKINTADSVKQMLEFGKAIDSYSAAMLRAEKMTEELVQSNTLLNASIDKVKSSLKGYANAQLTVINNYKKEAALKKAVNRQYQDEISGLNRVRTSLNQYKQAQASTRRVAQTSGTASKMNAEQRAIRSVTIALNKQAEASRKVSTAQKTVTANSAHVTARLKSQANALLKTGIASKQAYEHSKRFIG